MGFQTTYEELKLQNMAGWLQALIGLHRFLESRIHSSINWFDRFKKTIYAWILIYLLQEI